MSVRLIPVLILLVMLAACDAVSAPATGLPTPDMRPATLAPSPTVSILSSDELYAGENVGQNNLTAAALPNEGVLPPRLSGTQEPGGAEITEIVMTDGTILLADLYQQFETTTVQEGDFLEQRPTRFPGVLLLAPDRLSWGILPLQLNQAGMTVLAVDLTASATPDDVRTLLTALSELSTVDPARIAVAGAGPGANVALAGCSQDALCDALVLLSPSGGETLMPTLAAYNPRPLLLVAGQDDLESYPTAVALAGAASGETELLEYPAGSGTQLIDFNISLASAMVDWLRVNVGGT